MDEDVRKQLLRLEGEIRGIKVALGTIINTIVDDRATLEKVSLRLRSIPLLVADASLDQSLQGGIQDALDSIDKALAKGG